MLPRGRVRRRWRTTHKEGLGARVNANAIPPGACAPRHVVFGEIDGPLVYPGGAAQGGLGTMLPTPRTVRHVAMACDRSASRVDHEDYCHGCCSCLYRSKARSGLCWLDIGFASATTYCVSV